MEVLICLYGFQLIFVYTMLMMDEDHFESKKSFLLWNLPFIPMIFLVINNFRNLGRKW